MSLLAALRMVRFIGHLLSGIIVCSLFFPFLKLESHFNYIKQWSIKLLNICNVKIEYIGLNMLLKHSMVVANHISWLDIFVINSLQPCRFIAKYEVRKWPVLGWLVAQAGTLFVIRNTHKNLKNIFQKIYYHLKNGERIAFFPEGTSAAQGKILPFYSSLFEAAIQTQISIQPFAISYWNEDGSINRNPEYFGNISFLKSLINIMTSKTIIVRLECLAPLEVKTLSRRELSKKSHEVISHALHVYF